MPLILTLTHLDGAGNRETRTISQGTFTIGRAGGNDWILPDPDRHLSKTHCLISVESGRYVLTDVSTNGVFVNGSSQAAGRDAVTVLTDGDEFRLGDYSITVSETAGLEDTANHDKTGSGSSVFGAAFGSGYGQSPEAPDPFGGAGPVGGYSMEEGPLGGDPLLDPFGAAPSPTFHHPQMHVPRGERTLDPFDTAEEDSHRGRPLDDDDLFAPKPPESWKGGPQADNVDAQHQAFATPKVVPAVNLADFDFDALLGDLPPVGAPPAAGLAPFQPPLAASPSGIARGPALPADFDDLSLDDLLGDAPLAPSPTSPELAASPDRPPPVAHAPAPIATDPQETTPAPAAVPSPSAEAAAPANPFDEGDLDAIFASAPAPPSPPGGEPRIAEPAPVPGPASVQPPSPTGEADGSALLAAFLEGAGVPTLKVGHDDPEAAFRAAGQLFRVMVEGVREVLMSRAAIKSEMRVEQTVIRARDNNALKFSITPDEAVSAMLMPNRAGYKAPLDASREAFADIKSHELAVMAGMQTALMSLLKRFDPNAIEKRLQPGMLDGFLPGARKARIWELFCATYKDLAKEAEDDFQSVFGNEFARAYDAQMRKF